MALEGTLQDMSLSDLFQIFRLGPKSGILVLNGGSERGVIYVAEGAPIDAALLGADRTVKLAQEEAIIQMLLWDNAAFVFRHDLAVCQRPARITRDSEWIVMEGMRRRDDPTRALPYHTIGLDTQLQLSPLPSSAESGVSLDVNQWRILSQVSSSPNLRTICHATGIAPAQAIRTVAELLSIGLVEVVNPAPAPRPKPAPHHDPVAALTPMVAAQPALAGAAASMSGLDVRPQVGRGLLDAIMRRVRGL
jgi:hypothetical protein